MAKIEVWCQAPADKPVRLALRQSGDMVILMVVDERGSRVPSGDILAICPKGVYLFSGMSSELGLPVDGDRVKLLE